VPLELVGLIGVLASSAALLLVLWGRRRRAERAELRVLVASITAARAERDRAIAAIRAQKQELDAVRADAAAAVAVAVGNERAAIEAVLLDVDVALGGVLAGGGGDVDVRKGLALTQQQLHKAIATLRSSAPSSSTSSSTATASSSTST
jgi:hypothetical protein